MPQTRGSCGHIRAAWDNPDSCLSCAGCNQDNCCPFCENWSIDTWASVDLSRAGDATCVDQVKVGKVRLAVTFPHTTTTTCHQEMSCIGPCSVTTPDKICLVRSSGTTI
ncbi:hypothetical protein DPMN_083242 [Dreissena polymorpha]|uniref:Uncharacterized protein n=1 Tax=Dreissena polymorpha TaxID=45954 RepID=A0A9D4BJM1_DREPO|nr:hypothetical protein DPMN_083242 [Dreissena polymorpha]